MSKTKEEYMELAYKDGLAGFFAQLNEQGTTDYGIFDGTVTKQIPECAITSVKYHQAKTLQLDIELDDENGPTLMNAVWPAGLEKDDLIGAPVKVNKYLGDSPQESSLYLISAVEELLVPSVEPVINGSWYSLCVGYVFGEEDLIACYERSSGIVVFAENMPACDRALTTYLDSLS